MALEAAAREAGIEPGEGVADVEFKTVAVGSPVYGMGTEAHVTVTMDLDADGARWVQFKGERKRAHRPKPASGLAALYAGADAYVADVDLGRV